MKTDTNGSSFWRTLSVALIGALLAGVGAFVTLGGEVKQRPTRPEVSQMIQVESPYNQDRQSVTDLRDLVRELTTAVNRLNSEVSALNERTAR